MTGKKIVYDKEAGKEIKSAVLKKSGAILTITYEDNQVEEFHYNTKFYQLPLLNKVSKLKKDILAQLYRYIKYHDKPYNSSNHV